ncbi:HEAT repeat-containing protein 3 [Manduca sexta]|uniref:HEAT repeat-containing protein 3 n=1 Tax=Manduca sexta TaxID=7130 RepID=UPI00188E6704|nr:HEAT repeat-containing protein 3 [Manduca sexta]
MGKVRKHKTRSGKKPLPNDDNEDEEQLPTDGKENAIQTILDQLQAANVEEKYCGLQTLGLLIESPENIEQVLNRDLAKVVAPLLVDAASSVRNAAAGMLRNLSTVKLEVCDALMEQDVMTPLICYFHEHAETWTPDINSATKDEDIDTFIQNVNLLLNLCEGSELAIKYMGQSRILDILPRYLDISVFNNDIVAAVLQCLFVVVEDNPIAMEKIKSNCEKQLQTLLSLESGEPDAYLLKTLSAGVIISTCRGKLATLPINVVNQIISILAKTLSVDHRFVCSQLSNQVPLGDTSAKKEPPQSKLTQLLNNQIKSAMQIVDAQQSAIEIIANICSNDDGDENNSNESSESEEADEELIQGEEESIHVEDMLPTNLLEALINLEIFDKVWARSQLPAHNVMMILKEYEGTQLLCKKLSNLQTRALLCVNNMLSSLPIEHLGGINAVYKIWVDAGKLVFKQDSGAVLLESATAVMRAALDKIKLKENGNNMECNLFSDLALSDIEMMLTGIRECQVAEIRANLIRMIGILALLLVNKINDITSNVICTVTEFILEQAHKENEVWVLAEAIDTIVDLYSEDETDALAAKVNLVDKLMVLTPILKNKARQQKKLPKEYKVLVSTAVSNLPRFIRYKKDRISKL